MKRTVSKKQDLNKKPEESFERTTEKKQQKIEWEKEELMEDDIQTPVKQKGISAFEFVTASKEINKKLELTEEEKPFEIILETPPTGFKKFLGKYYLSEEKEDGRIALRPGICTNKQLIATSETLFLKSGTWRFYEKTKSLMVWIDKKVHTLLVDLQDELSGKYENWDSPFKIARNDDNQWLIFFKFYDFKNLNENVLKLLANKEKMDIQIKYNIYGSNSYVNAIKEVVGTLDFKIVDLTY